MTINIFTDGACSGNPGMGGWGAVIVIDNSETIDLHGGAIETTNNQMELTAVIKVLKFFNKRENLDIFPDSLYVRDGISSWIQKWKVNGWKTSNKKPVKNQKLWVELDQLINQHNIKWHWVKGHAGNKYNERADQLARKYIDKISKSI